MLASTIIVGYDTATTMDLDDVSTALAQPDASAPSVGTDAMSIAGEYPRLPPRSVTTGDAPRMVTSPRPLYPLQPAVVSWATLSPLASPQPLIVDRGDTDQLKSMLATLADQKSFASFFALATGSAVGREAAARCTRLCFLEGSGDVDFANVPSIKLLYDAAPNLTHLSINFPVAPPMSVEESSLVPDLTYLCIDEANGAWSVNRMAETLDVLQTRYIRELEVHNASPSTVQKCVHYLDGISICVLVDDGDLRYLRLVDRYHFTHLYDGALIAQTRFLLTKENLGNIVTLTLGEWAIQQEVELIFGAACPPRLDELHVWFGGLYPSLENRIQLLEYRGAGRGRCKTLMGLHLTTRQPVARIAPRGAPLRPPLLRCVVEGFLRHLHGRDVVINVDVRLELDGVVVEGCDIGCANAQRSLEHSASFS